VKNRLLRVLPVVLFAAACLYTYKVEESETHCYTGGGVDQMTVETRNGSINVLAGIETPPSR
jgi:hypothetical protein